MYCKRKWLHSFLYYERAQTLWHLASWWFSFFDESRVWSDDLYPYRIRFKNTPYHYDAPLELHDIYDLRNEGKIWNFSLNRASGTNVMFSISDNEFRTLLYEYSKINPYTNSRHLILEPYPIIVSSLLDKICLNDENQLKYEAGVMAYLLSDLTVNRHKDLFGNYTDYLCYAPTNTGREIDILLCLEILYNQIRFLHMIFLIKKRISSTKKH